jgi:hypothetical protein
MTADMYPAKSRAPCWGANNELVNKFLAHNVYEPATGAFFETNEPNCTAPKLFYFKISFWLTSLFWNKWKACNILPSEEIGLQVNMQLINRNKLPETKKISNRVIIHLCTINR